jgi:hypothetical protein
MERFRESLFSHITVLTLVAMGWFAYHFFLRILS